MMKKTLHRVLGVLLSAVLTLSMAFGTTNTVFAASDAPPDQIEEYAYSSFSDLMTFGFADADDWLNAINKITVNGTTFSRGTIAFWGNSGPIWDIGSITGNYGSYTGLKLVTTDISTYPAVIVISADNYADLTISAGKDSASIVKEDSPTTPDDQTSYPVTIATDISNGTVSADKESAKEGETITVTATPDSGYVLDRLSVTDAANAEVPVNNGSFSMPASAVTVNAIFKKAADTDPSGQKEISISRISVSQDFFGQTWYFTFPDAADYVAKITGVSVNGTGWEKKDYGVSGGGSYRQNTSENRLEFAAKDFSSSGAIDILKSGDVVTITADGYKSLIFKIVIDTSGNLTLTEDDGQGDPYKLHAKLVGSFESALIGQKDYDGISGASTNVSSNKNSNVTVYGALVKGDAAPTEADWQELSNTSSDISVVGSKCRVNIVPDTQKGTDPNSDSGMAGVYLTLSSALTLSGTPKDPGNYLISIVVCDDQGRTATSNALPFQIYTGDEKLADRLIPDNLTPTQDGKYMWNIMAPWAIRDFGSNVTGETESVRVPDKLKAWYGSNTSGTYGYLGYDLAWKDVEADNIPQTLYIPAGCDLTFVNMEILSSVKIIVENGGKLNLRDSTVQGIIEVQSGGTFSMNYDSFNEEFLTGASLCGQLRLEDGAILENAAIYSHSNYLANGDLTDRSTSDAVVSVTGNVSVRGKVFIEGDSAGTDIGQTALLVRNGTVTIEKDAILGVYGGDGKTLLYSTGGTAAQLDNGTITGEGKFVGIGGDVLFGDGGTAVSGNGTISAKETFLRGATAFGNHTPGLATDGNIRLLSPFQSVEDGTQVGQTDNDPLADLYWNTGIDPIPNAKTLELYRTEQVPTCTITYTDGVDAEELFADQIYTDLVIGADTPLYNGTPSREGYIFKGWSPQLSETVKENMTYTAQWEKQTSPGKSENPGTSGNTTNSAADKTTDNGQHSDNSGTHSDNGSGSQNSSTGTDARTTGTNSSAVKTGDNSPLLFLALLLLAAAIVIGNRLCRIRRKTR